MIVSPVMKRINIAVTKYVEECVRLSDLVVSCCRLWWFGVYSKGKDQLPPLTDL